MTGEVDGYIYLGQQTPAFYAKQVVASIVDYGMSLLPPFFGGLMAYDAEANIAFACPGHQGGAVLPQVAGRPALLQALRRADLPQRPVQRRRRARRPADPRGRRRRRRSATPRRCSAPTDLLRAERHEHVQQGRHQRGAAARRPGAVRPQQPQVAAPGRAGPGRRDPDLPADGAQPLRHDRRGRLGRVGRGRTCASRSATNPLVKDPERHKAERPFRLACIQLATYDGTVYNVRKVLEKIGHLCDYVLWDEAWIGYNAFHPLFDGSQPDAPRRISGPTCRGCSPRSRCTSRAPASRRPRRSTSATSTSAASGASSSTSASTNRS